MNGSTVVLVYATGACTLIILGACALNYVSAQPRPEVSTILVRHYPVTVRRVVDADTLDLEVELGLEIYTRTRVRLTGIDAWEVRGPERERGQAASQFAQVWLDESQVLEIRPGDSRGYKRGKYGRWLVYICRPDAECLNDRLVTEGHAERSDG